MRITTLITLQRYYFFLTLTKKSQKYFLFLRFLICFKLAAQRPLNRRRMPSTKQRLLHYCFELVLCASDKVDTRWE